MRGFFVLVGGLTVIALTGCSGAESGEDDLEESSEALSRHEGRVVSESEVVELLRKYEFPSRDIPKLVCTAKYESTFFEGAINENWRKPRNRPRYLASVDRGLFQINSIHLAKPDPRTGELVGTPNCPAESEAETLFQAEVNVKCARQVYSEQGMNAWYGYRSHRAECDAYRLRVR